jgi:hypothetical protein
MATETRNQLKRNDRALLWTLLAVAALIIIAYASYASYRKGYYNTYENSPAANSTPNTTTPNTTTPNTQ